MLSPSMNRFLSLVAAASVLPLLVIYALLLYVSTPSATGGIDPTNTMICYISFTIIFGALITVALIFSRQLSREARGEQQTP